MFEQPESQVPHFGVLALVVESNDVARVAASLNLPCATVRGIVSVAAHEFLSRYMRDETYQPQLVPADSYSALVRCVKLAVSSDVLNVISLLSQRERLEIFEAFAYFRAFCNSPAVNLEINHGQV